MVIKSLKDQKILSNIIEDARIPISELAKKIKLSREIVQYRLKNLEKYLIAGYQARVNLKIFYNSM
jgi:DNA-binding Lrp family transcriptional regulator